LSNPVTPGAVPDYLPVPVAEHPHPPVRRATLGLLAANLTPRDQWILGMVHEHRVLTTHQITALAFSGDRPTRRRLALLVNRFRVLDRFRPRLNLGSAPEHYVLGPAGATWLAATFTMTPKEFGYHRSRAHSVAVSAHLAHSVGCNDVFTAIAAAGRRDPAAGRLAAWWSERRCARLFDDSGARPDGYGHFTLAPFGADPDSAPNVRFFLEYDTGSEPLGKVAAKMAGYAKLAATTAPVPVLFFLHSRAREVNLHRVLAEQNLTFPVATTSRETLAATGLGPARAVWRPVDGKRLRPGAPENRLRLLELGEQASPGSRRVRAGTGEVHLPLWWTEPPNPLP
jgi:hypothetical protein